MNGPIKLRPLSLRQDNSGSITPGGKGLAITVTLEEHNIDCRIQSCLVYCFFALKNRGRDLPSFAHKNKESRFCLGDG